MSVTTIILPGEVMFGLLKDAPAVNALLLRDDGKLRIYPGFLQEQKPETPCAYHFVVSDPEDYTTGGRSILRRPIVQLDLWDATDNGVATLAAQVRLALSGYRGIAGGADVRAVLMDSPERGSYDSDVKLFRRSQDWRIYYREA